MSCGSWCAYYKDRNKSVAMCKYCPDYDKDSIKPRQLGNLGTSKSNDSFISSRKIKPSMEDDKPYPENKGKGRWCPVCKQYSIYQFDDHWECLNVKSGVHDTRSASQYLTEETKTWNDK
jgi:hypothetical protein